jgi:hypothetical protein
VNVEAPLPLWIFMVSAFVGFEAAGLVAARICGSAGAAAARLWLVVIWLLGAAGVTAIGWRQYGAWALPPAATAVAVSIAIVYAFVTRRGADTRWPWVAARASMAAVVATVVLPFSLLLFLVWFGVDGP